MHHVLCIMPTYTLTTSKLVTIMQIDASMQLEIDYILLSLAQQ